MPSQSESSSGSENESESEDLLPDFPREASEIPQASLTSVEADLSIPDLDIHDADDLTE
jgi:hypothetical protein